jgi:hypothetical protein
MRGGAGGRRAVSLFPSPSTGKTGLDGLGLADNDIGDAGAVALAKVMAPRFQT